VDEVKVRTPLTCETRYGLCAQVLRPRPRSRFAGQRRRGGRRHRRAVDRRAGYAADHADLPRRWCGLACAMAASRSRPKSAGVVRFTATMRYVTNAKGEKIVITRSGEVLITDDNGRERERHKVPYGATLRSMTVSRSRLAPSWPPGIRTPARSLTEYAGTVKLRERRGGRHRRQAD
jgi:DNA-directed RNA polymerase subunit beta'